MLQRWADCRSYVVTDLERVTVRNKPPVSEFIVSEDSVGPGYTTTTSSNSENSFIFDAGRKSQFGSQSMSSSFNKPLLYCQPALCPCVSSVGIFYVCMCVCLYLKLQYKKCVIFFFFIIFFKGFPKRQLKQYIKKAGIFFSNMNSTDRNNCKADDQWDSSEEIEDDDGGVDMRVCMLLRLFEPFISM
jgi:hypothetical protein